MGWQGLGAFRLMSRWRRTTQDVARQVPESGMARPVDKQHQNGIKLVETWLWEMPHFFHAFLGLNHLAIALFERADAARVHASYVIIAWPCTQGI